MIRASLLAACLGLALAAGDAAAQTAAPAVQFTDRTAVEHVATAYLPDGAVYPGGAVDGSLAPVLEREVAFNGRVDVSLVGVSAGGQLALRDAQGATMAVRVRCFWADADDGARRWAEFDCFRAGAGAPPASPGGAVRRVVLRAYAIADAAATRSARAGRYSGSAYFRVDAM